jgi:hypothetical protein
LEPRAKLLHAGLAHAMLVRPVHARLLRAEPWHGKVWLAVSAEHWCALLLDDQR